MSNFDDRWKSSFAPLAGAEEETTEENVVVHVTEQMLKDLWDDFAESEESPLWDDLTQKQRDAALMVVQGMHEEIDEYHAMVDAIEGAA